MRNPARKALYCLIAFVAGAALIWFGFEPERRIGEDWTSVVPVLIGFCLAPFGLVFLIQALFAMGGRARLLAGHGLIARWRLTPAEWDQFRSLDARRAAEHPSLLNDLVIRKATPDEGVDVIVGETSLLVDRSYHVLRPGGLPSLRSVGWLDGPLYCLEFALLYPRGRYGGSIPFTLRVPVPPSAHEAARAVFAHYEPRLRRRPPLALRNPPKTYRICALIFTAGAAAGATGYGLAQNPLPDGAYPVLPLTLMVVWPIVCFFGLVLAFFTWLLTKR